MVTTPHAGQGRIPATDFRAKATLGVALASIVLLLPIGLFDLANGQFALGVGTLAVVFILSANAWMVRKKVCHQRLTVYGLVPAGMVFITSTFQGDGIIACLWCYPSVLACYCMLEERRAWLANFIILLFALPMAWLSLETGYALRVTATLGAVSVFAAIMVNVIDEQQRLLQEKLVHDPLTGLLNRLTFNDCIERSVHLHGRYHQAVSLLAIDIDRFKQLNDTHGHAAGDRVLSETGTLLRHVLRDEDQIFRMGGEEFTVILRCASIDAAVETAERVRQAVASTQFEDIGQITVSIGVAEYIGGERHAAWAKRADDSLYEAKREGRNRVVASEGKHPVTRAPQKLASVPDL